MKEKILLPHPMDEAGRKVLLAAGFELIDGTGASPEILRKEGQEAQGIILHVEQFGAAEMDAMPNLKVIGRNGVGVDNIDLAAARERQICVVNTPMANYESVADIIMMSLLMLERKAGESLNFVTDEKWLLASRSVLPAGRELSYLTLGIVGLGRIGIEVAKRAQAFGMRVIAYNPREKQVENVEMVSFDELLQQSDVVSLNCPGTAETYHLINQKTLAQMKNSAFLINFARGSVVNTADLTVALQEKIIAGAELDVFEEESLPLDSPLMKLDNVLLFPHIGSFTIEARDRMAVHAAQGVIEVLQGKKPSWAVV